MPGFKGVVDDVAMPASLQQVDRVTTSQHRVSSLVVVGLEDPAALSAALAHDRHAVGEVRNWYR